MNQGRVVFADKMMFPEGAMGFDGSLYVAAPPNIWKLTDTDGELDRRDTLIHAIYGGVYGKPHAVIENHKRTGDLMPAVTHFGAAAPSGLTRYASRVFGDGASPAATNRSSSRRPRVRYTAECSGAI